MSIIPEIASELINKSLSNFKENNSRTIFLVGSKSVVRQHFILNSFGICVPTLGIILLENEGKRGDIL